jgi:hypothetical protein
MNDRDFDKTFGDRLREERRFNEDDSDWQRLMRRLDAVTGGDAAAVIGNSNTFRRWFLPLIALLLLLTTGLLFGKLNNLDKTNTALMEQMKTFKTQVTATHDTVFITKTDTIFIEQNATRTSFKTSFIKSKTDNSNSSNTANYAQLNKSNNGRLVNPKFNNASNNSELITPNSNANFNSKQLINAHEKELKDRINELESKLQDSENQRLASDERLKELEDKVNKKSLETSSIETGFVNQVGEKSRDNREELKSIIASKDSIIAKLTAQKMVDSTTTLAKLKDKGPLSIEAKNTIKISKKPTTPRLFAGVSGGLIYYKSTWVSPQNNVNIYRNEKSYQAGLKLEYALTDHLRLTAGGDFCPFDFKIFWQDSRYNLPTPMHYYPSVDKIKSSKALQQLAQGSIGAKYLFTDGTKRWRPYVGAAYTAMKILPFETEFEVQNVASGAVRTLTESSSGLTIANLLLLDGGLEYRFNRRFVVQGEAFYNLDMNRPQKTYDLFGVRGAFLLNF